MKRNRTVPSARRKPIFPLLIGFCLLSLLGLCLFPFLLPQAEAHSTSFSGADAPDAGRTAAVSEAGSSVSSAGRSNKEEPPWNLALVNVSHPLPEGPAPKLSPIDSNGEQFDSRAAGALQAMLDDMRSLGLSPLVCSSFRAHEEQVKLFRNQVQGWLDAGYAQEEAEEEASLLVARPGTSEHELGLAADIVAESNQLLDESQEHTAEQQWLLKNCQEYGFILRYPTDKTEWTGVSYEPWHYRYVGTEAAKEIMSQGLCLEEYLGLD